MKIQNQSTTSSAILKCLVENGLALQQIRRSVDGLTVVQLWMLTVIVAWAVIGLLILSTVW